MSAALISSLHAHLLRSLSEHADYHYQGLAQAARSPKLKLTPRLKRQLHHLDIAHNINRHITSVRCHQMIHEINSCLASTQNLEPTEGKGGGEGDPEVLLLGASGLTKTSEDSSPPSFSFDINARPFVPRDGETQSKEMPVRLPGSASDSRPAVSDGDREPRDALSDSEVPAPGAVSNLVARYENQSNISQPLPSSSAETPFRFPPGSASDLSGGQPQMRPFQAFCDLIPRESTICPEKPKKKRKKKQSEHHGT